MGLLSGFKAKLKSNKYKKSQDIVCVNYKINSNFDEPGSSFTYKNTAIWNNSPNLSDRTKTTRSPKNERTRTTSFISEIGKNNASTKRHSSSNSFKSDERRIRTKNLANGLSTQTGSKYNEESKRKIEREQDEHHYNEIEETSTTNSGHYEELDENIKSVLIFMSEDHESHIYDGDSNNNQYVEPIISACPSSNLTVLEDINKTETSPSNEQITSVDSSVNTLDDTNKMHTSLPNEQREDASSQESETGKTVRFAEENSYHDIMPRSHTTYNFSSPEEDEQVYEEKFVNPNDLSADESEEDDEKQTDKRNDNSSEENERGTQGTTKHRSSLQYYDGMAFSSQASNIFFGGEDFEEDQEEENVKDNVSNASSFSA